MCFVFVLLSIILFGLLGAVNATTLAMIATYSPAVLCDDALAPRVLTLEEVKFPTEYVPTSHSMMPEEKSSADYVTHVNDILISHEISPDGLAVPMLEGSVFEQAHVPTSTPPTSPPKQHATSSSKAASHKRNTICAWSRAAAIEIKRNLLHTSLGLPHSAPLVLLEFLARMHLEQLPERYIRSLNDVDELLTHMVLMHQVDMYGDFRVSVRHISSTNTTSPRKSPHCMEITICCLDKPKVAALLTRVLDGAVRDVIEADIMTSKRNVVLDRFIVDAYPHYTPELLAATISSSLNPGATPQILREIGRGLTCITYEALAADSTPVIMKRPIQPSVEDVASFTREAQLMQSLPPHPNICAFLWANLQQENIYICYEYLSGGSLARLIRKQKLSIDEIVSILLQVARGMLFLHSHHVLHRDLKSTNVMLDGNGVAKICDFGISRYEAADMTAETGTYRWMAPEVIRHERYGAAADVYSFAILAWELLAHNLPYASMTPVQAAFCVVKDGLRPEIPGDTPAALSALVKACWDTDPNLRPTFAEIVSQLNSE